MHDSTKVLLGTTQSSVLEADNRLGAIDAGLGVCVVDDGTITVNSGASGAGPRMAVSLGKDLSNTGRTALARKGLKVPVILASGATPLPGVAVYCVDADGKFSHSSSSATLVNAIFASGVLTGIKEDGTTANVALIDFPGGL